MESPPTPPKRSRAALGVVAVLVVAVAGITVARLRHQTPSGASVDGTITLERSACQGDCPVFTLTLDTDGTITWEGREHVATKGTASKRIDPKLAQGTYLRALSSLATLHDEYTCERGGLDTATIRFASRSSANAGQIKASPACPTDRCSGSKAFCDLAKTLETTAGAAAWIECKDAAGAVVPCPSGS